LSALVFVRFILSFARNEASSRVFSCDFQVMPNGRRRRIYPKIGKLKIFFELMEKRQNIEIAQNIDPRPGARAAFFPQQDGGLSLPLPLLCPAAACN